MTTQTGVWNLEERLLKFAARIVRLVESLPISRAATPSRWPTFAVRDIAASQ